MPIRPTDPLELLQWINDREDDLALLRQGAMFDARLQGRFEEAITVSGMSRKRALALTRHENEERGRMVRWQRQ